MHTYVVGKNINSDKNYIPLSQPNLFIDSEYLGLEDKGDWESN